MRKSFKAFTLVEMLIVMGIIIILMAIGIASGRFAIQRANKIEHQNAAENIYQALQSYYSDNREYPGKSTTSTPPGPLSVTDLMDDSVLGLYVDDFEGGSEATYAYVVDGSGQEILVCVTYGGNNDLNKVGIYCAGNGIGSTVLNGGNVPNQKDIDYDNVDDINDYHEAAGLFTTDTASHWNPSTKAFTDATGDPVVADHDDYTAP
jgi:type II secretory pathway pseudopilin PulG